MVGAWQCEEACETGGRGAEGQVAGDGVCWAHSLFGVHILERMECSACGHRCRLHKYSTFSRIVNATALRDAKVRRSCIRWCSTICHLAVLYHLPLGALLSVCLQLSRTCPPAGLQAHKGAPWGLACPVVRAYPAAHVPGLTLLGLVDSLLGCGAQAEHPLLRMDALLRASEESDKLPCDPDTGGCGASNIKQFVLRHAPQIFTIGMRREGPQGGWSPIQDRLADWGA